MSWIGYQLAKVFNLFDVFIVETKGFPEIFTRNFRNKIIRERVIEEW